MDKLKLITWMGYIEAAFVEMTHGHKPRETLARATDARMDFTADANCASIKDPTDTPPPSSWPSVSRIRKETRAEVVAEIHRILNDAKTASVIASALRSREDFTVVDVLVGASAFIAGHMGKSE